MTKAERFSVLNEHFIKQEYLEGNPPSILWKHRTLPNLYAFTSEYEARSENEIIFVKSNQHELNDACKFAVKHIYQSKEQLEIIVSSLMPAAHEPSKEPEDFRTNPFLRNSHQSQQLYSEPFLYSNRVYNAKPKRRGYIVLAIIAAIILIAIATNPSVSDHREAVKEKFFQEYNQESLRKLTEASESGDDWSAVGAAIDFTLGSGMAEKLIPSFIYRSNFLLFSFTEVHFEGKEKIIGVGLLGNVWIGDYSSDDISTLPDK